MSADKAAFERREETFPTCGWDTGGENVWTGPARCGKPAKATTNNPATNNRMVCGIHARKAKTFGAPATSPDYYTVTVHRKSSDSGIVGDHGKKDHS